LVSAFAGILFHGSAAIALAAQVGRKMSLVWERVPRKLLHKKGCWCRYSALLLAGLARRKWGV